MIDYSEFFNEKALVALFSTNDRNYKSDANKKNFIEDINLKYENFRFPSQTHSSNVLFANKSLKYNDTDGLVSESKSYNLGIVVADCVPIFLFDPLTKLYGLVHSGWRGSVNSIVKNAIDLFQMSGSKNENIQAVLGPAIGHCCFEIEKNIIHLFDPKFLSRKSRKKYSCDLKSIIISDLLSLGLKKRKILNDSHCTFCNRNSFFSYRRQGETAGRMLAVMGWKGS